MGSGVKRASKYAPSLSHSRKGAKAEEASHRVSFMRTPSILIRLASTDLINRLTPQYCK